MNRQEFTATGSYPLSTQTMALLQESIAAVAELSRIGGPNYILSGCEQAGNSVNKGIIVINGEPMPFAGGVALPTITVVETTENIMANGTEYKNARIKRQAQFATGTGENYLPWANFKPLSTNQQLEASIQRINSGIYEPSFQKNSAFNKNFGTTDGTVAAGNHGHPGMMRIIAAGEISTDGSIVREIGASFTIHKRSAGNFTVTHNLASSAYMLMVCGIFGATAGYQAIQENTFDVQVNKDSGFSFIMYAYL